MARYAITIFLSAFLLFQVQPLIGKFILPWFGGSPAVWTSCMLFFQVALLAGYSYAHFITSKLSQRSQMICHLTLLIVSLAFLPISPNADFWKPRTEEMPIGQILALLATTIGLPYFLLSTTGPLLQESFRRETGRPPYRLYSLSNVGSLLALLTYPFAFEPALKLQTQIWGWSIGYALFVVMCGWCALQFTRPAHASVVEPVAGADPQRENKPTWRDILLWLALAACGSVMLLATTNQLCQEISAVPFLWVLPLAIYLITFIFCFDHERWYHHNLFLVLLTISVLAACYAMFQGTALGIWTQLAIYSSTLWVCCMVCHGELVRAKPAPKYATLFYLMVSAGGAAGGILVAIVAPLVLNDYWEYHIALIATIVLAFFATYRGSSHSLSRTQARWVAAGGFSVAVGLALGWGISALKSKSLALESNLETTRNFYGVLHVNFEDNPHDENGPKRELINGRIQHGYQYMDPDKSRWPTTYYGHPSGIGLAIDYHPRRESANPLRIGVVGLGCGTLAVYGRPGDTIRFYEINPEVIRVSDEYFTYLSDSEANVEVVLGDARIKMEQELAADNAQQFDILAIDAFSSDAIPMHLLTLECVRLFLDHLQPDGILCLHISNRFLDLSGVVRGIANELGYECVMIDSDGDESEGRDYSSWAILTKNQAFLETPDVSDAIRPWNDEDAPLIIWTDDYGSLWQAIAR